MNFHVYLIYANNWTFQSGLSKLFSRVGVIFPLISSRGRLSSPPPDNDDVDSNTFTVFFGTADAPCRIQFLNNEHPIKNNTLKIQMSNM